MIAASDAATVCVDGYNLAMPHGSGIATYGHTLLEAAADMGLGTQVLYGPSAPAQAAPILNEAEIISGQARARKKSFGRALSTYTSRFGVRAVPVASTQHVHWPRAGMRRPSADQYWMARELYHLAHRAWTRHGTFTRVDFSATPEVPAPAIMHWTCPLPVTARGVPNLLTVHDVIPLMLPHSTGDNRTAFFRLLEQACHRADHILSVSETTKADLVRLFPGLEPRISVTYQPVLTPEPTSREDVARWLKDALNLEFDGYFLFYGAIEPKKNLGRIVEAYLESGSETPLVIVGGRQWLHDYEVGLLEAHLDQKPDSRILRLDYLPRSSLDRLIRGARATLFPSLYEGFGLPVLESMALGVPVIGSCQGAVAEIGGGAIAEVDPYDPAAIAGAIRRIDADTGWRAHLSVAGTERAVHFSPSRYGARLAAIYRDFGLL